MAKALSQGLGTSTNLICAYAWLKLYSETMEGAIVGKVYMNELALKLDTLSLQKGQDLAGQFNAGRREAPVIRSIPDGDPRLRLNGITFGSRTPFAVINGKTVSEGETTRISVKQQTLEIKCLKIEKGFVTIKIEGEESPRTLRVK